VTTVLPRNRTPWETAVEGVSSARFPLPTHLITDVWNPDTCPVELLPYLAYGLSVDLWSDDWPETHKREACRKALRLHRLKTTPAGVKAHVAMVGSEVLRIIRPPARESLRGAMTEADRLAWLEGLPQVRIYPFYSRSIAKSRSFYNGPAGKQFFGMRPVDVELGSTDADGDFTLVDEDGNPIGGTSEAAVSGDDIGLPKKFLRKSRGFAIYGRRATIYDRGAETEVTIGATDLGDVDRVYIRRKAPLRLFYGHGFRVGYLRTSAAETNVITVRLAETNQHFAVDPSMTPVDVRPARIAQKRTAPAKRAFFGRHGGFLKESFGPLLIYDRIALNDPSRLGARRKVRGYHGHGRFGIDPFTAEIRIRVPMLRKRRRACRWHGAGFRKPADMAPLNRAIEAVRVSKAFRDTVLIDTHTQGRVTFGGGLRFGEFVFGQIKEVQ
jgi:phage tail P2-like protein